MWLKSRWTPPISSKFLEFLTCPSECWILDGNIFLQWEIVLGFGIKWFSRNCHHSLCLRKCWVLWFLLWYDEKNKILVIFRKLILVLFLFLTIFSFILKLSSGESSAYFVFNVLINRSCWFYAFISNKENFLLRIRFSWYSLF